MALPLGLNKCPPFHSITGPKHIDYAIPPPQSAVEDELRRNLFWLAYAIDRTSGLGSAWAFGVDDEDVGQFFPARGDLFEKGVGLHLYSPSLLTHLLPGTFHTR